MFLADEELLQQARRVRPWRDRVQPATQRADVVEPVGRLRAGTGRGLRDEREPDRLGELQRLAGAGHQLVPGTGYAGVTQYRLHPRLVPDVARGLHVHAFDAHRLADLGERHLKLFQRTDEPLDAAQLAAQARDPFGDLARVQRVVDPPVPGQVGLQFGRQPVRRRGRDDTEAYAGHLRGGRHEARRGFEQEGRDEGSDNHGVDGTGWR